MPIRPGRFIASLFLFAILAPWCQAQALNCTASVSTPPTLRMEGNAELLGDIVLKCTGGSTSQYTVGTPLPTANISVTLTGASVTSRLLNTVVTNASEAVLLIDEPGSGQSTPVPGTGAQAPQTFCSSSNLGATSGGCLQYPVVVSGSNIPVMSSSPSTLTNPANLYMGEWFSFAPNQIQFVNVPILPPVLSGLTRTYRITNLRVNASYFLTSNGGSNQQVNASVTIGGNTQISLANPFLTAGFLYTSLGATAKSPSNGGALSPPSLSVCSGEAAITPVGLVAFSENLAPAWKTRVVPTSGYNAQGEFTSGATYTQNIPGGTYSSESGFVVNTPLGVTAGLADYGTRLKATFHGLPSGVRLFVSVNNVANSSQLASGPTTAVLVNSETTGDGGSVASFPAAAATTTVAGIPVAELPIDGTGSAVAVWEVTSTNPSVLETANFAVYQLYTSAAASGAATVNLTYAATPPANASGGTLAVWDAASGTLPLPRFVNVSSPLSLFNITACGGAAGQGTLTVTNSPAGNFTAGQQGAVYFATVTNGGSGPTTGSVTVTDNVGAGLTLVSASGTGWFCFGITCSRSDPLGPGTRYPPLTLTMNIAANAQSPVTNVITVSGGGSASFSASATSSLTSACAINLSPGSASLPATGTSSIETCPNSSGQAICGVAPGTPALFSVTAPTCGSFTATSSNPAVLQIVSTTSGNPGQVQFTLLSNTHTVAQSYSITITTAGGSVAYPVTEAGSGNNQMYREVYALYQQILGRDPDAPGLAFWTGSGSAGLGQMADSFLTSSEAFNSDFGVMAAYQAATGAPPTYAQFTAALAATRANAQSLARLFQSLLTGGYNANNLYQNLLNRQPGGADSGCINSGLQACFLTIIGFPSLTSPVSAPNNEFQSTGIYHTSLAADHTNAPYIQMLYYVILGRGPDPAGAAFWVGVANSGGPGILFQGSAGSGVRAQILGPGAPGQGFIGSPEFQGLFAN